MKHPFTQALSVLALCLALPNVWAAHTKAHTQILYTQVAASASIQPDPKRHGWSILTLHHVNNKTTWFTDRPQRMAGVMSTRKFIHQWHIGSNSFAKNPPNANLVAMGELKQEHLKIEQEQGAFELADPRYDLSSHTLVYSAKGLPRDIMHSLNQGGSRQYMHEVALFIDSGQCTPAGGCS